MKDLLERWDHNLNRVELQQKLTLENIRADIYSLNGGLPSEVLCLGEENGKWEVYYSERGNKAGLRIFDNEEEACQYFYDRLHKTLNSMGLI